MDFFQYRESLTEAKIDDLQKKMKDAMSKGDYGLASKIQKQIDALPASAKADRSAANKKKVGGVNRKSRYKDRSSATKKEPKPTWKSLSGSDKKKVDDWGEMGEPKGRFRYGKNLSKNPNAAYYTGKDFDVIQLLDDVSNGPEQVVDKSQRVPNNKLQDAINYWVHEVMGAYN